MTTTGVHVHLEAEEGHQAVLVTMATGRRVLQLMPRTARLVDEGMAATVELPLAELHTILAELDHAQDLLAELHTRTHGLHTEGPVALCPVCTP